MRRMSAILMIHIWIILAVSAATSAVLTVDPTDELVRRKLVARVGDMHAHCDFDDGVGPYPQPGRVIERALGAGQQFFLLTPHAEQVEPREKTELMSLAADHQYQGNLVDWGMEVTGSPEYRDAEGNLTILPGDIKSWGHVLLFRSARMIGYDDPSDGPNPNLDRPVETYADLLRAVAEDPQILAAYPHPELYPVETSFDGFRPSGSRQFFGCELSSHGPDGYHGPGNVRDGLRASNEACWRELMRPEEEIEGDRLSPLGTTDEHDGFYGPKAWTVAFLDGLTIVDLHEAFEQRLTGFTEVPGAYLVLAGWYGDAVDQPVFMGESTILGSEEFYVNAEVVGSQAEQVTIVVVAADAAHDREYRSHLFTANETNFGQPHLPESLRSIGAVAIYAKATVRVDDSVKQLVSAPIFIDR
ncbi:hypothetical protein HY374_00265 [Candidatus Berkelbacteria bacterium]|nr:hypothetical protein [Candidatus Berkelbacteria bacterium]